MNILNDPAPILQIWNFPQHGESIFWYVSKEEDPSGDWCHSIKPYQYSNGDIWFDIIRDGKIISRVTSRDIEVRYSVLK